MCFLKKKLIFRVLVRFAQKVQFYALQMLKNKISRILKLPSWQHCLYITVGSGNTDGKHIATRTHKHSTGDIVSFLTEREFEF